MLRRSLTYSLAAKSAFGRVPFVGLAALLWLVLFLPQVRADEGKVHGTIQYEKIPFKDNNGKPGLQLNSPKTVAVIKAKVELVTSADNKIIGRSVTDASGAYEVPYKVNNQTQVFVRVLADSENADVRHVKKQNTIYSTATKPFLISKGDVRQDHLAGDKDRGSGPFNILEAIRLSNELLRKFEPGITIPRIRIYWSTDYVSGTFFRSVENVAYINGKRDEDSDEFDDFVLIHEYGHFVMSALCWAEGNVGGPHKSGDMLDPRLAWSEGWANFFACAVLNDPFYVDTYGRLRGDKHMTLNLDENHPLWDSPGVWSEHTVGSTLWDLFDARPGDVHQGVGFGPIWKALRGPWRTNTKRYASLIDFCDLLVKEDAQLGPKVAAVLAAREIKYSPGKTPSVDDPYPRLLPHGIVQEGTVDTISSKHPLLFDSMGLYTFSLTKKTKVKLYMEIVRSKTPAKSDLDIHLMNDKGKEIAKSDASNRVKGTETIERVLEPGRYYLEVRSWARFLSGQVQYNSGTYRLLATYTE